MSDSPPRAVFDCNVYLQALGNANGPSGRCVSAALEGQVVLCISPYVLDEVREVSTRPEIARKFRIPPQRVERLLLNLLKVAVPTINVPDVYSHPFDPDDSHYVNLGLAGGAEWIVSRDRHFLNLMDKSRPQAVDFIRRFPGLRGVSPPQFLAELLAH